MCSFVKETVIELTEKLLLKYVSFQYECMLFFNIIRFFICMQNLTDSQKPHDILESTTNSDGWKLELERVLPQLKVTIKTGMKLFPIQSLYSSHIYLIYLYCMLIFMALLFKKQCNLCRARGFTFRRGSQVF